MHISELTYYLFTNQEFVSRLYNPFKKIVEQKEKQEEKKNFQDFLIKPIDNSIKL